MHAQGALILLPHPPLITTRDGWLSQPGLELHRRKEDVSFVAPTADIIDVFLS
jgi:hypothetical protein